MKGPLPQIDLGDSVFEVAIDSKELSIDAADVGRALGYPGDGLDDHFKGIIETVLERLTEICRIRAGYRVVEVDQDNRRCDGIFAGGEFFSTGRIIADQLKGTTNAALFACTIGSSMESWSREAFREGDMLKGHFIDTAASVTVERVCDMLHNHIGFVMADRGLGITNRFSPGYCGWPLTQQRLLFSFFPPRFCGISLTDSALMLPVKSVSGLIGVGAQVKREAYFCGRCARKDCTYRAFKIFHG